MESENKGVLPVSVGRCRDTQDGRKGNDDEEPCVFQAKHDADLPTAVFECYVAAVAQVEILLTFNRKGIVSANPTELDGVHFHFSDFTPSRMGSSPLRRRFRERLRIELFHKIVVQGLSAREKLYYSGPDLDRMWGLVKTMRGKKSLSNFNGRKR